MPRSLRDHPLPLFQPPQPPQPQLQPPQHMSLSHLELLFHTIVSALWKSFSSQIKSTLGEESENQCWWKVPRGKLIGSPGKFFNHNRLQHPPGPGLFAQGSRLAARRVERSRVVFAGCSLRAWLVPTRGQGPSRLGDRVVRRGRLGVADPDLSLIPALPAGCPWASRFAFLSLSFPFWKVGVSRVLTLQDHCGIIDTRCTAAGRH